VPDDFRIRFVTDGVHNNVDVRARPGCAKEIPLELEHVFAFVALTAMEIVLGIDNIVFIAILTGRLPPEQRPKARKLGLMLALVARILLLMSLSYLLQLTDPIIELSKWVPSGLLPEDWLAKEVDHVSIKDLILLLGGLFLIVKSVREIDHKVEGEGAVVSGSRPVGLFSVLVQVAIMDIVFSLDSVITAVGMVKGDSVGIGVMIAAVMIAVAVMLIFSESISGFVERHPSLKMLALSFLILIGVMLVAEGVGTHFNKGYIYFAMAFSLVVEFLNIRARSRSVAHS
jgi:predicted tellurium resistance membrane protein TerC